MSKRVRNEPAADYTVDPPTRDVNPGHGPLANCLTPDVTETAEELEQRVIGRAIAILDGRIRTGRFTIAKPKDSATYLRLRLSGRVAEAFCVLWLDNRHRVLALDELFQGTVDGASVHTREVVRAALKHNACAAILAHNHPSGVPEPSTADRNITRELSAGLGLIGVRVLDHLVIGDGEPVSMAERGLL